MANGTTSSGREGSYVDRPTRSFEGPEQAPAALMAMLDNTPLNGGVDEVAPARISFASSQAKRAKALRR
jgi:hypothetical protein